MRALTGSVLSTRARCGTANPFSSTHTAIHGRTAAYRRLSTSPLATQRSLAQRQPLLPQPLPSSPFVLLRSYLQPRNTVFRTSSLYTRHFHSRSQLYRQENDVKTKTAEAGPVGKEGASSAGEKSAGDGKEDEAQGNKAGEGESSEKEQGEKGKEKSKEEPPPPPPHGDKTPWQVFTETLKSEFKASKEWNESTKALASGVNDFTQNPTVQKAKSAYSQATDAATSKTAEALKTTGKAIGHGAAWTWDTPMVKGVRKTVNAAGRGIEKVTRPVRETEAYKSVKEIIDDGSSSRYGGWVEKEERRKKRELRELNELQRAGGKHPTGPIEEDPEYDFPVKV